jgi:hypothetical protein
MRRWSWMIGVAAMLLLASTASAQVSCGDCQVPLYTSSCASGTGGVLQCNYGGPGTCCNPTIKASENATSGETCNSSATCLVETVGNTTYSTCCCNNVFVTNGCGAFVGGGLCSTSTTLG